MAAELGDNMMMVRIYENAGHEFFSWSNQADYMTELKGFLAGGTDIVDVMGANMMTVCMALASLTNLLLLMN